MAACLNIENSTVIGAMIQKCKAPFLHILERNLEGHHMEKEIWKWILETFTDEGIANMAFNFGIKIPGFRQINHQHKKFKILRQRIIQEVLHQKNTHNLVTFYNTVAAEEPRYEEIRGKSFEELLHFAEEEMHPSMLLGLLMSSEDEEDQVNAEKIFTTLKDRLDLLEKLADEKGQNSDADVVDEKDTIKQLKKEIKAAQKIIERHEKKLKKYEQKNEELKALETQIQTTLKNERKQWKTDKNDLHKIIQGLKGDQTTLNNKVTTLSSDKDNLNKKLKDQTETVKTRNSEIARLNALVLKLNTDMTKLINEKEKEHSLTEIPDADDHNSFKILLEAEKQMAAGLPTVLETEVTSSRDDVIEEQILADFVQRTKVQGLLYDEKDLYNFHTAMKSSNLVILAGMSGIGKSKLVQAYGEALCLSEKYQMTFIPVRPSWTDDADVIGYPDTLDNVYRPGDSGVINALLSANQNKNKLHIICFDEMNLARVEHYFSQFLSILELEAGPNKVLRLYNEELKGSLKNSALYPPVIPIGDNVIFVGTVNVDESTYHFSDKVLDRANVITPTVMPFENLKRLSQAVPAVKAVNEPFSLEMFNHIRSNDQGIQLKDNELAMLWEIHSELQKVNKNLGVGPRIVRQIDMYLKNLPSNSSLTREEAFDKQIVQRILTKVRGPEDQLKHFIGSYERKTDNIEDSK
ncbi:MAG: family ATPase, partial [Neobacillus sp.]|nr:family ATPase [Neobacillus sp.]